MSEEEILDKLRKMLYYTQKANECGLSNNDFKEHIEALEGILDLYNKEKEKNKELKVLIEQNLKYSHNLEKDLFENCSNYVVSKDKIKEIIYPTPTNPISYEIQTSDMYRKILQLLEEE